MTVLVVEDEEDLRVLLTHNLRREGISVAEARDGLEAMELLETTPIDLILADLCMPRMGGIELCERVKSDPRLRAVPFIMLTAKADAESQYAGIATGAADYITKPVELTELLARIRGRLHQTHSGTPVPQDADATFVRSSPRASPMGPVSTGPLPEGHVLNGRYRICDRLGDGGMGSVYIAEQMGMGRRVALKWMHLSPELRARGPSRFRREAELASRVRHPHVVSIFDYGLEERSGNPFLVMELVLGRTLKSLLREHGDERLPLPLVVAIVRQMAQALSACHEAGIIHRDLKQANIILDETRPHAHAVLVDFGIARSLQMDPEDLRLTRTGELLGTPLSMSPEQVLGRPTTPASDLYGLGCLLHELLTGHALFTGDTPFSIMTQHVEAPRPALPSHVSVPAPLAMLRSALLEVEPDARPSSAGLVAELLADIAC